MTIEKNFYKSTKGSDNVAVVTDYKCSDCGAELYKHVNYEVPCPKCGGKSFPENFTYCEEAVK